MAEIEESAESMADLIAAAEKRVLNGRICCLVGGCGCPPGSVARAESLAAVYELYTGCSPRDAARVAAFHVAHFGIVSRSFEEALLAAYLPIQALSQKGASHE